MRGLMYGLRLLVVALALFFTGAGNLAQNVYAVPVAAQSNNQAKAFFVLDTSNSMIAALEHPEADLAASAVTDTSNELPDVIFTLESGSSNPNSSHNLRPVLVAFNYLFNNVLTSYRGQVTGNLFEGDSLNQATDMALVQHMGCTTSSAYCLSLIHI